MCRIKGIHINLCVSMHPRSFVKTFIAGIVPGLLEKEEARRSNLVNFPNLLRESAYFHMQATKPDTIGKFLMDFDFVCAYNREFED